MMSNADGLICVDANNANATKKLNERYFRVYMCVCLFFEFGRICVWFKIASIKCQTDLSNRNVGYHRSFSTLLHMSKQFVSFLTMIHTFAFWARVGGCRARASERAHDKLDKNVHSVKMNNVWPRDDVLFVVTAAKWMRFDFIDIVVICIECWAQCNRAQQALTFVSMHTQTHHMHSPLPFSIPVWIVGCPKTFAYTAFQFDYEWGSY